MLAKFRHHYPQGSIVSELIDLDRGLYLVKVTIRVSGEILATGLAAAERVELAEDRARERAIALLALDAVPETKTSAKTDRAGTSKIPTIDRAIAAPVETATNNANKLEEDYLGNEVAKPQQPDFAPNEEFQSASATPEPQSDSLSSSSEETPVVENGNLFAGTFEPQSPAAPEPLNFEASQEAYVADSEPVPANKTIEVNFDDIKHQTDIHIKRLGWTKEDGVNFLKSRYGKRSRLHLKDEELLEFLNYLENQPTPQ